MSGRGSLLKKLLTVFVACVYSLASTIARAESTPTSSTPSLLGVELRLDTVQTWTGPDGQKYVGWPESDAEAILYIFEQRIPLLIGTIEAMTRLNYAMRERSELDEDTKAELSNIALQWKGVAESWKTAAKQNESILNSKELWLLFGAVVGCGLTALVLSGSSK